MSNIIICETRKNTMRQRLGAACALIDGDDFLPLFRSRQINFEKEFNQSVKMVKSMAKSGKIKSAKHYFAKIWKKESIERTLKIVREFLNRQVSKLAEKREQKRRNERQATISRSFDRTGREKFMAMKAKLNLS